LREITIDTENLQNRALAKRKNNNPLFKLTCSVRGLIQGSFKSNLGNKFKKNSKSQEILSCNWEEFKNHIESQFLPWMNWENHGRCDELDYNCTWHLDHIVPMKYAKTEEDIYLLNHWSNFQPMCGYKNMYQKADTFYPCTNLELRVTFLENEILSLN